MFARDLTAGGPDYHALPFPGGATEANLVRANQWTPDWSQLDSLIPRLGRGAKAANVEPHN